MILKAKEEERIIRKDEEKINSKMVKPSTTKPIITLNMHGLNLQLKEPGAPRCPWLSI